MDMDTVDSIIKKLYENPLGTEVDLLNLSIEQNHRLTPLLKKWYEDVINGVLSLDFIQRVERFIE